MRKIIFSLPLILLFWGCSDVTYNEQGVTNFINSSDVTYWVQDFQNYSNMIKTDDKLAIIISKKDIDGRQRAALKKYFKDKYKVDDVDYYYMPDYQ